jgi:serine/threonine protein kinase
MGNIVPTLGERSQDMQVILQTEFPEYLHIDQIGKGKFMKTHTVKRVSRDTSKGAGGVATTPEDAFVGIGDKAVVKIYLKRTDRGGEVNKRIALVREQLAQLCRTFDLYRMPNIIPYQRFEDNTRNDAAFLIRQHFMYNLYDRLNTRPFLTLIEKKWLIFQLLKAVQQIHDADIRHGDIKSENIMVTSWGWLLLTDFAVFKPTFIPEDHPSTTFLKQAHAGAATSHRNAWLRKRI